MGKSFMVAFSQGQADQIKAQAIATKRSSSAVVRAAVDEYFAKTVVRLNQEPLRLKPYYREDSDVQVR